MKNATSYAKKVKKLLGRLQDVHPQLEEDADPVRILVRSVLAEDASRKDADRALAALEEEFADLNELRASPPKDVIECVGWNLPDVRQKTEMLLKVLNGLFQRVFDVSVEYMRGMPKRGLRRHLKELGLSPYPGACLTLMVFGGHAVPVDRTLIECLEMGGYVHPGSDLNDVRGFLERIISQKDAIAAHEVLRGYVAGSAKALAKKRKADQAAAKKAAEAERKKKKKKKKKKAAKPARPAKAAGRRKALEKRVRKSAGKPAGKTKKKKAAKEPAARRSARSSARSAAAKAARKASGKKRSSRS